MELRRHILPEEDDRYAGQAGEFDTIDTAEASEGGPIKCEAYAAIEGWIIIVTGIHDEAQEDDVYEAFADYGKLRNLSLNTDRRTGSLKGYALIEYGAYEEAQAAIRARHGTMLLGKNLSVAFAFAKPRRS
jgi:RNA-binding protein 8A